MGVFPSPATIPSPTLFPVRLGGGRAGANAEETEMEIVTGRRSFIAAQALFSGGPVGKSQKLSVGWHDTSVNPETGSFAVVQATAGLDDLVGEIIRVTNNRREVFVYVLDTADVPVQVSLARRAFVALYRLTVEALPADVVVVG